MSVSSRVGDWRDDVYGREIGNEKTLNKYEKWVRRFELWRGPNVSEDEVRQFDSYLDAEDRTDYPWENRRGRPAPDSYSYSSRVVMVSALKQWFPWRYEDAPIETDAQDLARGEPEPFDPHIVDEREIERTVDNAPHDCNVDGCAAALRLSYDAILRGAELAAVKTEDINFADGTMYVRSVKNSRRVTLGLSDDTLAALQAHVERHPDREQVFHHSYGSAWKPQSWNNHVRERHHPAGSHALFRHSAITHRLNRGEQFGQVYRRARHSHPSMTANYAKVVDVDISVPTWAQE